MHSISYLIYRFLIACILDRVSDVIFDVYDVRVRFKYFAIINKKNKKCFKYYSYISFGYEAYALYFDV